MNRKFKLLAVFCVFLGLGQSCATQSPPSLIEQLAALQTGRFDSSILQPVSGEVSDRLVDWRQRLAAPAIGEYVFYQQLNHKADLSLYRQRILVLTENPATGALEQRAHRLKKPERFVDALADDAHLLALSSDDLLDPMAPGCTQVWTQIDEGFEGYVDPQKCTIISSRTGKPRGIEARSILTATSLALAERGYNEQGVQVFGSKQGVMYRLGRTN